MTSWIKTVDGIRLRVRRWAGDPASPASVVLVHGFAASSDDGDVVATAEAIQAAGFPVVTYDARGHGASGGLCTLGNRESLDVSAAVAAAHEDGERVVLVGASMGAIAALRWAAHDPDLAGVVTVSCPARWRVPRTAKTVLAAVLTQTPPGRAVCRRALGVRLAKGWARPAAPVQLVRSVTAPLAVVHGTADRFILPSEAAELHAAAPRASRLELVDGMGHAYDPVGIPVVVDAVRWAVDRSAQPVGASSGSAPSVSNSSLRV